MARLIVVSNRVPRPDEGANAGGLVTALKAALEERGGTWLGWSGRTGETPDASASVTSAKGYNLATIDLTESELKGYYNCFANRVLWPAFHRRFDLAAARHDGAYGTYRAVNLRFARALCPLLGADDTIWVQDYHLIPLGMELRRLGVTSPIGFFLHIPFPPPQMFAALPQARELAKALAAYDLIGFQQRSCAENFLAYVRQYGLGAAAADGRVLVDGHAARIDTHPIGIDTRAFAGLAASPAIESRAARIRDALGGRVGIAGVERLDYTKGIAQRFEALEKLLERHPEHLDRLTLFQVAAPSRTALPEYLATQTELETLSGRINGRFGSFAWSPIRYLNQAFDHVDVAALLRASRVGLVTPLRDGMNLVAKEYVAAQDPDDPGVLVLSRFAGAADELTEALLVNPHDAVAMAEAIHAALEMPREERLRRWRSMMWLITRYDVHRWQRRFLDSLAATPEKARTHAPTAA